MLRLESISKSFSGVPALKEVSFDLKAGEVHVLAGENGAGKSTLIKLLTGAYSDYQGVIHLGKHLVRFRSPHEAGQAGIAVIHQELSLVNGMSVMDNIFCGRERGGIGGWLDRTSQQAQAETVIARLGLDIDVRRPVHAYPPSVSRGCPI